MKKILFALFCFLCLTQFAIAQDEDPFNELNEKIIKSPTRVIKTNPLGLILGMYNLSFESLVSNSLSVELTGIYAPNLLGSGIQFAGANLAMHYYTAHKRKTAPEGFYIGPFVGFIKAKDTSD